MRDKQNRRTKQQGGIMLAPPSRQNMVAKFNKVANQFSKTSVAITLKNAGSFAFNRGAGVVGIIALSPFFLVAAGTSYAFIDKKNILYTQDRIGKSGKTIKVRKFKSMHDAPVNMLDVISHANKRKARTIHGFKIKPFHL